MKNDFLIYDGILERYVGTSDDVEIPEGVRIMTHDAFAKYKNIKSIKIPASVTKITSSFELCNSLEYIVVDENNPHYDSRDNCNAIVETATNTLLMGCKNTIIPEGVTTIATGAFAGCLNLHNIKIPEGVIKIEQFAFADCKIRNLLIPQSVTDIEFNTFMGCGCLEHIAVEEENPRYDSRNGCNAIVETATNMLLKGCKNTLIPQGISEIAAWAFDGCEALVEVIIPHSVKKIGEFAFADCNGLKKIIIPESVDFVNYCAFSGCEKLTKLVLPSSLTFIGANAFGNCDNLTIHCHAGSYAEQYVKEQGLRYALIDE